MDSASQEKEILGQYIPLHYHASMLRDKARMATFREALQKTIPEGGTVVDLGGGTGALSFFAAERASKVWCVERNPELVQAATAFLRQNPGGNNVEVVHADAMEFLPPVPVDVVVCEMLHSGLLREKQVQVIRSFQERYSAKFRAPLPLFIPNATLLAVQPVHQSFDFSGFHAPIPIFYAPGNPAQFQEMQALGEPCFYKKFSFQADLPIRCEWEGTIPIHTGGTVNALHFITKNILASLAQENRAVEWWNQNLVLPACSPMKVDKGDLLKIGFEYDAGGSIESLSRSIRLRTYPVILSNLPTPGA